MLAPKKTDVVVGIAKMLLDEVLLDCVESLAQVRATREELTPQQLTVARKRLEDVRHSLLGIVEDTQGANGPDWSLPGEIRG